jgi:hypothetical protein
MKLKPEDIPTDFEVKPLRDSQPAKDRATCFTCGLSWDDAIGTSWTPAPSARCPFEYFHKDGGPMNHEEENERRDGPKTAVLIIVRQWSRPRVGGIYGTASIYLDGKFVHKTEVNGGSENVHIQNAVDWLEDSGYMPGREHAKNGSREPGWRYFRDRHGIAFESTAIDVSRERDL